MPEFNAPKMLNVRKLLRSQMTREEKRLWFYLRAKKLDVIFHRQYSIGNYVVDFYCPKYKLAIELDGSQHNDEQNKLNDQYRSETIEQYGVKVIRFWNNQIAHNINDVLEVIWREVHP